MAGMPMPGGWTLSMAWMRMPGQSWPEVAGAFVGTWVAMMAAMMLPSMLPVLWRRHRGLARAGAAGVGYLLVWGAIGAAAFPAGVAVAALAMRQPALARLVPLAIAAVVVAAGAWQFTATKARHLAACRPLPARSPTPAARHPWRGALRDGVRLGADCARSCANLTALLLALGVMDVRAMALVTAAITAERLAPAGVRAARASGAIVVAVGVVMLARALAWGA